MNGFCEGIFRECQECHAESANVIYRDDPDVYLCEDCYIFRPYFFIEEECYGHDGSIIKITDRERSIAYAKV